MNKSNVIFSAIITAAILWMVADGRMLTFDIQSPLTIQVFAGNDATSCVNQDLNLASLGASISGDANDGEWITFGDGRFMPGNLTTIRFSTGVTYIPGPKDKLLGYYRLMLISDYPPVGMPQEKQKDEVKITFQVAPPLICSNNLNISLNEFCQQTVDVTMLQPNPMPPFNNYIITLYDSLGQIIPNNLLTKAHLEKMITFKIGHQCTSNTCWGTLRVQDYFPPIFKCKNDTIPCTKLSTPEVVGFPFPSTAFIDTIINSKYVVKNWDACSVVALEFTDVVVKAECSRDEDKTITRKWKATDAKGNQSICNQTIVIKRMSLDSVKMPLNFDDIQRPAFECGDDFPTLASGFPSPDTTGSPSTGYCGNLEFNMADIKFDLCGASYKVARAWFVIDWCTSESFTKNQIIKIKDSHGPTMQCPDTLKLEAGAYACSTENLLLELPDVVTDCSTWEISVSLKYKNGTSAQQFVTKTNEKYYFSNLPFGQYNLVYTAIDACSNTSECASIVIVEDHISPYPVCDLLTVAALDGQGKSRVLAASFDDGSTDNCGIASFKVAKMADLCGFGTQFGDYVDFCCAEFGTTQRVALQVTDIHGNKNTCMVEVILEDKIKPTIICPPNVSISCDQAYDLTDLSEFGRVVTIAADRKDIIIQNHFHHGIIGKDGLANDNCNVSVTESFTTNIHCNVGTILRKFIATDGQGLKDSCTQTIFIVNDHPFVESNITWPANYENNGCKSSQTNPDITGKPIFTNTSCATVAASYEDQPFYIADGACLKIIRTWTVVDWCQFSDTHPVGKWGPYIQTIKLHNIEKPLFTSICRDTSFCSYDANCGVGFVQIGQTASDDCTDVSELIWQWNCDVFRDGTMDYSGTTNTFARDLPIGNHLITWRVDDQCGNFSTCSQIVAVKDCKKPVPYCKSSLTIDLSETTGKAAIWAKDFNMQSFDNCTDTSALIFTFEEASPVPSLLSIDHYFYGNGVLSDQNAYQNGQAQIWIASKKTSGLLLDCSDIPNGISATIPLKMTVTDLSGNQDFCTIELELQDNNHFCPDLITNARVGGKLLTTNQKIPQATIINYHMVEKDGQKSINKLDGSYSIDSIPLGVDIQITPKLNSNLVEGVTAQDLVMIQRHILRLTPFDSPYKIIASDVNLSNSVTASDINELRRIILGLKNQFPGNQDSWTFVPKEFVFDDMERPYSYPKNITINGISNDAINQDFVAIKLGDVNESVNPKVNNSDEVENRSKNEFLLSIAQEMIDQTEMLVLRAGQDMDFDAIQLSTQISDLELSSQDLTLMYSPFESFEHAILGKNLRFVGYSPTPLSLHYGDIIASFKTNITNFSPVIEQDFTSEIYQNKQKFTIRLRNLDRASSKGVFALVNNPILNDLHIKCPTFNTDYFLRYTITNMSGQIMYESSQNMVEGQPDEISLSLPQSLPSGVYLINLMSTDIHQSLKFIKVR